VSSNKKIKGINQVSFEKIVQISNCPIKVAGLLTDLFLRIRIRWLVSGIIIFWFYTTIWSIDD